ncbi:MAG: TetR/AcrR family transcriptional regulator [Microbacteriaceae bacterium]
MSVAEKNLVSGTPAEPIKRGRGRPKISSMSQLEKVAVELFTKNGYQKTTIDDVADAAGVSRSTVFRYVNTKNQLLWLFAGDYLDALGNALDENLKGRSVPMLIQDALIASMSLPISEADIFRKKLEIIASDEEQLSASLAYKLQAAKLITQAIHQHLPKSAETLAVNAIGHAYLAAAFEAVFHWATSQQSSVELPRIIAEMFEPLQRIYEDYLKTFA